MFYDFCVVALAAFVVGLTSNLASRIPMPDIKWQLPESKDITDELYREYEFVGRDVPYRIDNPKELFVGTTTHRVIDSTGIVHCVPAPGFHGCVLRWVVRPGKAPVAF
jgi:hypothetical protein